MTPDLDQELYEKALAWARRAIELQPTTRHRLTLAAALYRSGKIDEALAELEETDPSRDSEALIHAALRCLCQFSGQREGGWQAYNEFTVLAQSPRFRSDREVADLKAEIDSIKPQPPWR